MNVDHLSNRLSVSTPWRTHFIDKMVLMLTQSAVRSQMHMCSVFACPKLPFPERKFQDKYVNPVGIDLEFELQLSCSHQILGEMFQCRRSNGAT